MFLGLTLPHPDPLVTSTDTDFHQFVTQVSCVSFEYSRFYLLYTNATAFLPCLKCAD
jgi:hypothetical protein